LDSLVLEPPHFSFQHSAFPICKISKNSSPRRRRRAKT
jgi:hypothetical protein